tara:strand:- start:363 stop:755 length:393 start_codon:yes stop_codon:yes gene_type:complete
MSEVNILSEIKAVFSFLEENGIESISQLEGKVIAEQAGLDAYKWDYCISAESLGRFLHYHGIEDQEDFDTLKDNICKTLMCDGVDDFSDVRRLLDSASSMREQAERISELCDDLTNAEQEIKECAQEITG